MERLFKVLDFGGKPNSGGSGEYSLPTKNEDGTWTPGEWMPEIKGDLIACKNGYHLCRENDLIYWLGPEIYEAEYSGERVDSDNKIVVRKVRLLKKYETWTERNARLFACWCVRQIWHLLEDERSKNAIIVAEKFANGDATREELFAARAAAWDAARAAAWDAARVAAGAAARAVSWDAARAEAEAAARDAQTKRLIALLDGEEF